MTAMKKLDMKKPQITMNNRISQPCKRKKSFTYIKTKPLLSCSYHYAS